MEKKFPGAKQICKIERIRQDLNGNLLSEETVYGITSHTNKETGAERLLEIARGHWSIENKVHYVRDVTFNEDSSRIRTGNGAHAMAIMKNFAINILRASGVKNISSAIQDCAYDTKKIFKLFCDGVR